MSDALNAMVKGLEGIPVSGNPNRSQVNFPINGPLRQTGRIVAYDPFSGILQIEADWDKSENKLRFNVRAKYKGQPGIPKVDEIEVGQFCDFHRVGHNNTTSDWVAFFPRPFPVIPAHVFAGSPGDLTTTPVTEVVLTSRKAEGKKWLRTNIQLLQDYRLFASGFFSESFAVRPESVLIREGDVVEVFRGTIAGCGGSVRPPKIYNLQVVPGRIKLSDRAENCWVFTEPGRLSVTVVDCCTPPPTETPPPGDPPEEPPETPPPPPPPPDEEETPPPPPPVPEEPDPTPPTVTVTHSTGSVLTLSLVKIDPDGRGRWELRTTTAVATVGFSNVAGKWQYQIRDTSGGGIVFSGFDGNGVAPFGFYPKTSGASRSITSATVS